jgi:hypothetical protein
MTRRRHLSAVFGLLLAGLVLLSACNSAERDDTGQIVKGGDLDVFTVKVGDCFQDPSTLEIEDVSAIPCSQPHDNEVYHVFKLGGSRYPGDEAIEEAAFDGCLGPFAAYVGTDYDSSSLDYSWLTPTERSWNELDDREIVCILYDAEYNRLTGSMKGSRQ